MKVLFVGAHPDDAEFAAGGVARRYSMAGHRVKFLVLTNGDAGHHEDRGPTLVERRRREQWAASSLAGVEYQILNHHDGRLEPTLAIREEVIAIVRAMAPDLILTHRPNDYHPDHRAASLLVQDASYLLTVPSIVPREPHMRHMPAIAYLHDHFTKPLPFEPDVVVSIDETIDDKIAMLDCHGSQFYEWLPHNRGIEAEVPVGQDERREWLGKAVKARAAATAEEFRIVLEVLYGAERGAAVQYAEAFEASEYGTPVTSESRPVLFPFFGD